MYKSDLEKSLEGNARCWPWWFASPGGEIKCDFLWFLKCSVFCNLLRITGEILMIREKGKKIPLHREGGGGSLEIFSCTAFNDHNPQ